MTNIRAHYKKHHGEKVFVKNTLFSQKRALNASVTLIFVPVTLNFVYLIRILYAPLHDISFVSLVFFKTLVQANIYGQYAKN